MIYHIMIDRFAGCNSKRQGRCFKGGNLKGIIRKLSYIQQLGATDMMITPFYLTNEYHGYHILDYEKVDPHFGTWEDVARLVKAVHRRGMTITADFVANHCHKNNALCKEHPDWFKLDKDGQVKGFEGIEFLPEFNLDHPAARRYMTERGLELCQMGFDAIRLDYAKGPSLDFWRYFRKAIKRAFPHVLLIGEVWGIPHDKRLPHHLSLAVRQGTMMVQDAWQLRYEGIFDGVLDFEYQFLLSRAARAQRIADNEELAERLHQHFAQYAHTPNYQLWLFLDNHDTNRFLFDCKSDAALLNEALELTMSQQRPYLYYYGTEIGMTHSSDVFSGLPFADEQVRACMKFRVK